MDERLRNAIDKDYTEPVRDPLWGHIYLTKELAELCSCEPFIKLTRILQLGPSYIVYPGASHTRAAHSLGVYHLARRLLRLLLERGADAWATERGARSFLAAALLHDIGHFPYAHSLKELPLIDHECLSGKLILSPDLRAKVAATGADPDFVAAIVDKALPSSGDRELHFYRKLLSGVLDPDKLDYLNRDARYCGVPYGAQDVDFTLSRLLPNQENGVDIDSRGIPSVEAILFAKYLMYRSVYWHRDVRSATAMVKKAVKSGLEQQIISSGELYGLDDAGLFSLLAARKNPSFKIASDLRSGHLYRNVFELAFDQSRHTQLADLSKRSDFEHNLADELSKALDHRVDMNELIIDLPEPVSFETGLYVADESKSFSESSTVFSKATIASFVRSLRVLRVFVSPELALHLDNKKVDTVLREDGKWLHST
ncbi:HD domain-containing protein [Treponema sp.]